ncbi:DegQ family serine endoprotease [Leeia oryzae]|uniref:DegQ family serine endoprotease n=1 Tax=Leeia oryzae TaxID=356662 RepID=UPI00037504A9|nr:DegQ family serine endoprotease [Leeia oryzae]
MSWFRVPVFAVVMQFIVMSVSAKDLPDFTEMVEKQGPAVVNISTTQTVKAGKSSPIPEGDPAFEFFRRLFPQQPPQRDYQTQSLGSGFLISADGYILTNAHVVDGADEITVKLTDKREFKGKVIGADKRVDVALLKIEASNLPKVVLGDPDKLKVGEWVVAIGSPFGLENSVTAGIVSAKGRTLPDDTYVPFIQTDAAVNPGNSGGPLFNMKGEVVGINSQIYSRSGGYMGLSFSVPIDMAMDVVNQLKNGGKISHGKLGVAIQAVSKDIAESLGLEKPMGALVSSVEKGSAADKAGIKAGDVILRFDNKQVPSATDLPRMVGMAKPGSKVALQVWRNKTAKELPVVLGDAGGDERVAVEKTKPVPAKTDVLAKLGLTVTELSAVQKRQLELGYGLLVTDVQGSAAKAGIEEGDVIVGVNNESLKSLAQFNQLLEKAAKGSMLALLVRREDSTLFVAVRVPN